MYRHPLDSKPYNPHPLDETWVTIGHMDEWENPRLMDVPEDRLEKAINLGWSVVFRWRDNPRKHIDPSQSGPNRTGEDEEC